MELPWTLYRTKNQSVSSSEKTSSTGLLNSRAIFMARTAEGTYLPCSMAMMAWRVTPTRAARSSWVMLQMARCIFMLFFMGIPPSDYGNLDVEIEQEEEHGVDEADGREDQEADAPAEEIAQDKDGGIEIDRQH